MLLPDNIHPELSIYYNGSIIIDELKKGGELSLLDLYEAINKERDISFPTFVLCLDWLYLIETAIINEGGYIQLCL